MSRIGRVWVVILALAVLASAISAPPARAQSPQALIDPPLEAAMQSAPPDQRLSVIVTLREQADLKRFTAPGLKKAERQTGVVRALHALAERSQKGLLAELRGKNFAGQVGEIEAFWVFNGLSLQASASAIQALARRADIESIRLAETIQLEPSQAAEGPPTDNLVQIHAPDLWALGLTGQGVVVANIDTGVDGTHPDLLGSYRGGANSWYDATGEANPTPVDLNGHGTQTMGVMVAGSQSGRALGVAPGAKWIAARIFNASNTTTEAIVHDAFAWILDPDRNSGTPDAPDVVNNSWTSTSSGCSSAFQLDIDALRAAGIVPVFAAGNYGPNPDSSRYPANNPGAFPVGAVNGSDQIWNDPRGASSLGPSSCPGYSGVYPLVTAPGVNIYTTTRGGTYTNTATGTSLAAPHVAGALALLLSTGLPISVEMQEQALMYTAQDLGASGPDDTYGYGRIDVLAAYHYIKNGGFFFTYLPLVLLNQSVRSLLYLPWIVK